MSPARWLLLLALFTSCATAENPVPTAPAVHDPTETAPAAPSGERLDTYQVALTADGQSLDVEAVLLPGLQGDLIVAGRMASRISGARRWDGAQWAELARAGEGFDGRACTERGCQLRYRVDLGEGGERYREVYQLYRRGDLAITPPSAWLLHSAQPDPKRRYRLEVKTPPGISFVSGVPRVAPDTYEAWEMNLLSPPFSGFGKFIEDRFDPCASTDGAPDGGASPIHHQEVDLASADADSPGAQSLSRWAHRAGGALCRYYGRFPVPRVQLIVVGGGRGSVGFGTTLGNGGAAIVLWVGSSTTDSDLDDDWVLVHEMIHLSFPGVPDTYTWMTEGLATYLEPVIRAQAGIESPEESWRGLIEGLPQGLPESGDQGLDRTPTWGRVYWGGALFWLMTDLAIRDATGGQRSLKDAMRGLLHAGGSFSESWPVHDILAAMDAGTGTRVVSTMYAQWSMEPVDVNLHQLWDRLGVHEVSPGRVTFNDAAPAAATRKALMGK